MIKPAPLGFDDEPQVKMTSVRVSVEPLVRRGNCVNAKAGKFQRVAGIEPKQPIARQPQLLGVVDDRLGQHEHCPW